jgi:hypothetical protein
MSPAVMHTRHFHALPRMFKTTSKQEIIEHYGCLFICFTRKKCIKERSLVISIERSSRLIYANSLYKKYLKLKLIGLDECDRRSVSVVF